MNAMLFSIPELLARGWALYKRGFRFFTKIGLWFWLVTILATAGGMTLMLAISATNPARRSLIETVFPWVKPLVHVFPTGWLVFFSIFLFVAVFLLLIWLVIELVHTMHRVHVLPNGEDVPSNMRETFTSGMALTLVPAVLLVSVLYAIAVLGGFLLLIVPGIIFMTWFCFSIFIVVIENERGVRALKKSKALVRGRTFAILLRVVAIAAIFAAVAKIADWALRIVQVLTLDSVITAAEKGSHSAFLSFLGINMVVSAVPLIFLVPALVSILYVMYLNASGTLVATPAKDSKQDSSLVRAVFSRK